MPKLIHGLYRGRNLITLSRSECPLFLHLGVLGSATVPKEDVYSHSAITDEAILI